MVGHAAGEPTSEPAVSIFTRSPLVNSQDFQQEIHKKRYIERDQKQRGDSEFIPAAGENVGRLPINVFRVLN